MTRGEVILIAAVAKNNVIGSNGVIPWDIPEERALFRELTMGHAIIMGRKTFDSIGRELPGRKNIVLSRTGTYSSIEKALQEIDGKDAFVIGGAEVYAQMMPIADEMRISHLKQAFSGDTFFPHFALRASRGKPEEIVWRAVETTEFSQFTHIRYTRI